jgi:hypothetical protein
MSMTRCLTDEELQAVADHEADASLRSHAQHCPACRTRVEEVERHLARLGGIADRLPGPSKQFEERMRRTMNGGAIGAPGATAGATTMRRDMRAPVWQRRGAWTSGLAAAALVVLAVFVVWPSLTKESHLSAAEILGRSLQTFSATNGVETFEYDVQFEGVATRTFVPDGRTGSLRVEQVIDHDHPGRFRVTKTDAANTLRLVLAQDPERGTRVGRFRIDDKTYFFKFVASPDRAESFVSLPDLQRAYVRSLVSMMQHMSDQKLATVDDGSGTGPYYAIQMPKAAAQAQVQAIDEQSSGGSGSSAGGALMWDLSEAHALVHAGDFHLKELSARGTFLGQPFGIAFTLVRHDSTPSNQIDEAMFSVEPEPGDIVLQGEATSDPAADIVLAALRALGQTAATAKP